MTLTVLPAGGTSGVEIIFPSLCEKIMFLFLTKAHYVSFDGDDKKRPQISVSHLMLKVQYAE